MKFLKVKHKKQYCQQIKPLYFEFSWSSNYSN